MNREPMIQSILQRLRQQPWSVAVEAAYLIVRYLSHRLSKANFLAQVEAEPMLPYRCKAVELALDIVSTIEQSEGTDASRLPDPVRLEYERQLTQAILEGGERDLVDRSKVDAALRELRGIA